MRPDPAPHALHPASDARSRVDDRQVWALPQPPAAPMLARRFHERPPDWRSKTDEHRLSLAHLNGLASEASRVVTYEIDEVSARCEADPDRPWLRLPQVRDILAAPVEPNRHTEPSFDADPVNDGLEPSAYREPSLTVVLAFDGTDAPWVAQVAHRLTLPVMQRALQAGADKPPLAIAGWGGSTRRPMAAGERPGRRRPPRSPTAWRLGTRSRRSRSRKGPSP